MGNDTTMRNINFYGTNVEIFDDPDEMTFDRFRSFQIACLTASQIGSDLAGIDNHYAKIASFIQKERKEESHAELLNLRQTLWNIQNGIDMNAEVFFHLVKSINGKENFTYKDFEKFLKKKNISLKDIKATTEEAKKKINDRLKVLFPKYFQGSESYYDQMREVLVLKCRKIAGEELEDKLNNAENAFLNIIKPKNFNVHERDSEQNTSEIEYNKMCHALGEHTTKDVKKMTVTEVYALMAYADDKIKAINGK